jgi:hypothetical protein
VIIYNRADYVSPSFEQLIGPGTGPSGESRLRTTMFTSSTYLQNFCTLSQIPPRNSAHDI